MSGRRSARWRGATTRCSAATGSSRSRRGRSVATLQVPRGEPAAYDPKQRLDDGGGRRHPARPRRLAGDRGTTARTSRSTAAPPTITGRCKDCSPLRLGHAVHAADRPRRGRPRPDQGRGPRASPTSRTRRPNDSRFHSAGTVFSADPGLIDGLANAGIDWVSLANNHIGDAGDDGILQTIDEPRQARHRVAGAGQGPRRGPQGGASSRPAGVKVGMLGLRRDRAGYHVGDGPAPGSAQHDRPRRVKATSRRRARPAPTSSSCSRTGASSTGPKPVRRPAAAGRGASTPAPTWSSATTPTGRRPWRSTRASRSGTRSATSSSTRPGPSRRWRASRSS